ncbi:MAG: methyltransferase family protein, partial [Nitrososphaerales archaeon]
MTSQSTLSPDQKFSKQALVDQVMGDLVGFWKVQIIYAGSKLGILDYLKRTDKARLEEISKVTQIPESRLKRLMEALVVMGYINRSEHSFELGELG